MYVYLLWDDTDNWGSNGKVKLHSVHLSKDSALRMKNKQYLNGEYFYIQKREVLNIEL